MTVLRRALASGAITLAATLGAAGTAQAASATFYVNGATGNNANPCTSPAAPCKTIQGGVEKAEVSPEADTATIEVAAGVYTERVVLKSLADNGITINGAGSGPGGTEIEGPEKATEPTVELRVLGGAVALSNASVVNDKKEDSGRGIETFSNATLTNVFVTMAQPVKAEGILSSEIGSLTMHGGGVTMQSGSEGFAIAAEATPERIDGATILVASGSLAGGIAAELSSATVTSTLVNIASATSERPAIIASLGALTLNGVSVIQNSAALSGGQALEDAVPTPLTVNGLTVQMTNAASKAVAVDVAFGTSTFERLMVSGTWKGLALGTEGGNVTLADSRLGTGSGSTFPTLAYVSGAESPGLVIQRSVLQSNPSAKPATLVAENGNVTLDSSEVLGGETAVLLEQAGGKTKTLTVAGSTIDAGNLGVADGGGVRDLIVAAPTGASIANTAVEGSILLEQQTAVAIGAINHARIACSNSDVPSQSQAEGGTNGAIECATGSNGNTHNEPASLFSAPVTAYQLNPSSSAVDSVPAGAISLPFGLTPSATDLLGTPRVVDGNGDCLALQDRGALELQGHAAACPPAPSPAVTATPAPTATRTPVPAISALAISPTGFRAAPSGATLSAARRFGAKVTWRDSQAATATFTVLRAITGRRQGSSCRRPSRSNRRGRRCTLLSAVGSFTHLDLAGANSLHFSGRIKGRRLGPGAYVLQALPANAAGRGKAVTASFTIKK